MLDKINKALLLKTRLSTGCLFYFYTSNFNVKLAFFMCLYFFSYTLHRSLHTGFLQLSIHVIVVYSMGVTRDWLRGWIEIPCGRCSSNLGVISVKRHFKSSRKLYFIAKPFFWGEIQKYTLTISSTKKLKYNVLFGTSTEY